MNDDHRRIVAQAPTGAVFHFEPGVHRILVPIEPKDGQIFTSDGDAILTGARVVSGILRRGERFIALGQTQRGQRYSTGEAAPGAVRPGFPETAFVDGQRLRPVAALKDLRPGTFYFDYETQTISFGEDVTARKVEAGTSPAAFRSTARGVTISNLTIEQFSAPVQRGAIQGGEAWTVEHTLIRNNFGVGVTVKGGSRLYRNAVCGNGQLGIGGNGADITVEANFLHRNGGWAGIDPLWEGGGAKFSKTNNLTLRYNLVTHNIGPGLWTDIDNVMTLYERNTVMDNLHAGILHEISYAAVIQSNILLRNGAAHRDEDWLWGAQVQLQNSEGVVVKGNTIGMRDRRNGVALIQQDRGSGPGGAYRTVSNTVVENVFIGDKDPGATGAIADHNEHGLLTGNNTFDRNVYYLPDGGHWWWGAESGDSFLAYQTASGQDVRSHRLDRTFNADRLVDERNLTVGPKALAAISPADLCNLSRSAILSSLARPR
ncbi:MAG: right-handed parallel beta-helix repeat-containing protein [Pseudomonadota bacterium]